MSGQKASRRTARRRRVQSRIKTNGTADLPRGTRDPHVLINRLKPGQATEDAMAQMVVAGLFTNTATAVEWTLKALGTLDITSCRDAVVDAATRASRGDLSEGEALLMSQAISLNAIYTNLASRAALNVGEYIDAAERCMRLALKAQSQCRATVETLAAIKQGPTILARQANIAHGPQQVNNTVALRGTSDQPSSRAAILESAPNKLLEAHAERMDGGAANTAGIGDQALAALEARDGTTNGRGQSAVLAKRVQRRSPAEMARVRPRTEHRSR